MARDLSVPLRQLLVTALREPASFTAIVLGTAQGNVFGPEVPAPAPWPFVRVELPLVFPAYDGCSDASRYRFDISAFAAGDDERNAAAIAAAIATDIDQLVGVLVADPEATLQDTLWTGTQHLRDTARADGWHSVVSFEATAAG